MCETEMLSKALLGQESAPTLSHILAQWFYIFEEFKKMTMSVHGCMFACVCMCVQLHWCKGSGIHKYPRGLLRVSGLLD